MRYFEQQRQHEPGQPADEHEHAARSASRHRRAQISARASSQAADQRIFFLGGDDSDKTFDCINAHGAHGGGWGSRGHERGAGQEREGRTVDGRAGSRVPCSEFWVPRFQFPSPVPVLIAEANLNREPRNLEPRNLEPGTCSSP